MNNRFKELSNKAFEECCEIGKSEAWLWEQKFAEAIIKECVCILSLNGYDNAITYINEYFGLDNEV